jgi:predicted nucleotidyltransferase/HEPN domain-containing protein
MPPIEEQIQLAASLKKALLDAYDPEAIILFGSIGRGNADEFSDVDLLVVMETDQDVSDLSKEMNKYLDPIATEKHIIVRTPRDLCRQRDIPGNIIYSAVRDGQVLFQKKGWEWQHLPEDSYDKRKLEVIQQEYVRAAYDFLAQSESYLQGGNLFRCRDFAKFAAIRALKGIFVKHDTHPPRETDLLSLLEEAQKLEPDLVVESGSVMELNLYVPGKKGEMETGRCRYIFDQTVTFVKRMISRYPSEGTG